MKHPMASSLIAGDAILGKIDSIDLFITTPSAYRAGSNGLLVSEVADGGNTTYHWRHRYPNLPWLPNTGSCEYNI